MENVTSPFDIVLTWFRSCQVNQLTPSPDEVASLLQGLEQELGLDLPADLKQYFLLLDHHLTSREHSLFYGLIAMPLSFGLGERTQLLVSAFMEPGFQKIEAVEPPGTVRPLAFNAGWLPLAHDYSGAYLAVDLHPDEKGQVGQIINFGAREHKRFVLASSISEFFSDLISNIAEGIVEWSCEGGTVDIEFADPNITHPLDRCEMHGASALRPQRQTP